MKTKILLIQPYFGKLPDYFPLWLESARNNEFIDFLLITDDNLEKYEFPKNVITQVMSLQDFCNLLSENIDETISISKPYKLCDFKPAYGFLLQSYLKDYTHWGYFDLDMYLGDLSKYILEADLLVTQKIGMYGHLTIIQNDETLNKSFFVDKEWPVNFKEMITTEKLFNTDESGGINIAYEKMNFSQKYLPIADISYRQPKWRDARYTDPYQLFFVENGKTFVARSKDNKDEIIIEEVCYIHYQKREIKNIDSLDLNRPFYFSNDGLFNFDTKMLSKKLFLSRMSKGYINLYKLRNAVIQGSNYLTGRSNYKIKNKFKQKKMSSKQRKNRISDVIEVKKDSTINE